MNDSSMRKQRWRHALPYLESHLARNECHLCENSLSQDGVLAMVFGASSMLSNGGIEFLLESKYPVPGIISAFQRARIDAIADLLEAVVERFPEVLKRDSVDPMDWMADQDADEVSEVLDVFSDQFFRVRLDVEDRIVELGQEMGVIPTNA